MKRILLVSNYAWTIYNFRKNLINRLRESGYELYVQTEFDGYESKLGLSEGALLRLDIDRQGTNPIRDVRTIVSIRRAISTTRCHACLFFTIKPVVYGGIAATLSSRPFICNVTGVGAAFQSSAPVRLAAKMLFRLGLARASHVFLQNSEDREYFVQQGLVSSERSSLLPGSGVDLDRFRASPYPTGTLVFLLVARLLWEKGVRQYVEAARRIRATRTDVRFQLLGPSGVLNPGAIPTSVVNDWANEGVIEYLGHTDDVYPHLEEAHCVVLPSFYREGTPRSILEAAATARPVITTNHPGCKEVVIDGVTGLLCEPRNVDDLVRKMERVIDMGVEQRAAMGMKARERMEKDFSERLVLDRYVAELRKLFATTRSSLVCRT
jgi:glycosyltransferase involved in cell wall biosynthesis